MEDMPVYYDEGQGVYRLFEVDEDSGVEELPLSSFLKIEDNTYPQTAMTPRTSHRRAGSNCDFEDDDLTYIDDETDADYKPNTLTYMKKGKSKYQRRHTQHYHGDSRQMLMLTPEKQPYNSDCESTSSMRHYARKDRTPRTIMKMMERHRESERVRHHTLNESMKDVCLRVPGYDPDVKETKVIQMQRIIGYECFLENTLNSLCSQLGLPTKVLKLGTNFITDAMKDTPIEDFYQPSNYKMSDVDEEEDEEEEDNDLVPPARNLKPPTRCRTANSSAMEKNIIRYRRDKLPSLTVNSASDGQVKIYSLAQSPHRSGNHTSDGDNEDWLPVRGFVSPLKSAHNHWSQDSGIKVETPEEEQSFNDIDNLIEHGLCQDPEHLKSVTASFMKEEPGMSQEENETFNLLSSPARSSEHSFIFMRSPRAKGIWHSALPAHNDTLDTLSSREMQTVSPENVLETKKGLTSSPYPSPPNTPSTVAGNSPIMEMVTIKTEVEDDCKEPDMSDMSATPCQFSNETSGLKDFTSTKSLTQAGSSGSRHFNVTNSSRMGLNMATNSGDLQAKSGAGSLPSLHDTTLHAPTPMFAVMENLAQGRNKRKRYTPFRAPLTDIFNQMGEGEEDEQEGQAAPKLRKADNLSHIPDPTLGENFCTRSGLERKAASKKSNVVKHSSGNAMPAKVDHRRSSWMNGFMMFCQKNRAQLVRIVADTLIYRTPKANRVDPDETAPTGAVSSGSTLFANASNHVTMRDNPGVHNSHIQKMLGQMWRNMSPDDQEPYRAKAKQCSSYLKRVHNSLFTEFTESIVDTSKGAGGGGAS